MRVAEAVGDVLRHLTSLSAVVMSREIADKDSSLATSITNRPVPTCASSLGAWVPWSRTPKARADEVTRRA